MKSYFKCIISFVIVFTLLTGVCVNASEKTISDTMVAPNGVVVKIIKDDAKYRVTSAEENGLIYEYTYNKKTDELSFQGIDSETKDILVEYTSRDVFVISDESESEALIDNNMVTIKSSYDFDYYEKTVTNFEYFKDRSQDVWKLKRPTSLTETSYFMTYENSSNDGDLDNFHDAVEGLDDDEKDLVKAAGSVGITYFLAGAAGVAEIFTLGLITPAAVAAGGAAIGASWYTYEVLDSYADHYNACYTYYFDVFDNNDSVIFY